MLRRDFQILSAIRVREAQALAQAGLFDGAYYLGGLAVESALKAAIARTTQRYEFPDLRRTQRAYTHNLEDLLRLAGLETQLKAADIAIRDAWEETINWTVEARYFVGRQEVEAILFLDAVAGRHGVLRWLRRFW